MTRWKIVTIVGLWIVSTVSATAAGSYGGGSGTAEDPYQIWTAEQMNTIGLNPDGWDKHFVLMADIDLSAFSNERYNRIGTIADLFTGTFDGQNRVISNFTCVAPTTEYVGLFGHIGPGGQIRDLGLVDVYIVGQSGVGGLAGSTWRSEVSGCTVTGMVSAKDTGVGGLIGIFNEGVLTNCHAATKVYGKYYVGGLLGNLQQSNIQYCHSTGETMGEDAVGGLAGKSEWGVIRDSSAIARVLATRGSGGLVGSNYYGVIERCCSSGLVMADQSAGGLVGGTERGRILCSYSMADVLGTEQVGGLVGQAEYDGIVNCYSTGQVVGDTEVGGLVGYNLGLSIINSFWDVEASGIARSAGGRGRTSAAMQRADTYVGWNLRDEPIWTLDEGMDYPRFAWENRPGTLIPAYGLEDFLVGMGTAEDPYRISTPEQMNVIGLFVDEWDMRFQLTADIDLALLAGAEFHPIGGFPDWMNFTGAFDGNGYTISNLVYTAPGDCWVGLFGCIGEQGTVRDVRLTFIDILGNRFVGSLAGCNRGIIRDCRISGQATGVEVVGGLVGENGTGSISNCMVAGSIQASTRVGGLIGCSYEGAISDCSVTGTISGDSLVGGLIGGNGPGTIRNCHTEGIVTARVSWGGGLVGSNSGEIVDSSSGADVFGGDRVGGLIGENVWGGDRRISGCYAEGKVEGNDFVGGLTGANTGILEGCYAIGDVKGNRYVGGLAGTSSEYNPGMIGIHYCHAKGIVTGQSYVGGLVGGGSAVSRSYATGGVSGLDSVGGLIGELTGEMVDCYAMGSVTGQNTIGGLIGRDGGGGQVKIFRSYAAGHVVGDVCLGGLIGRCSLDEATFEGCFWDIQTTGQIEGAGNAKGMTTDQMHRQESFEQSGWDFIGVWGIGEGQTYPYLQETPAADLNADGRVDMLDLSIVAEYWLEVK